MSVLNREPKACQVWVDNVRAYRIGTEVWDNFYRNRTKVILVIAVRDLQ